MSKHEAARDANRKPNGTIKNQALDRRIVAAQRAEAIAALGMPPETAERYAATTGELLAWVREER